MVFKSLWNRGEKCDITAILFAVAEDLSPRLHLVALLSLSVISLRLLRSLR